MEFAKILIFITVDIFKHTAKKNKKIKRADQILPDVYGTTLNMKKNTVSYPIYMYILKCISIAYVLYYLIVMLLYTFLTSYTYMKKIAKLLSFNIVYQ